MTSFFSVPSHYRRPLNTGYVCNTLSYTRLFENQKALQRGFQELCAGYLKKKVDCRDCGSKLRTFNIYTRLQDTDVATSSSDSSPETLVEVLVIHKLFQIISLKCACTNVLGKNVFFLFSQTLVYDLYNYAIRLTKD